MPSIDAGCQQGSVLCGKKLAQSGPIAQCSARNMQFSRKEKGRDGMGVTDIFWFSLIFSALQPVLRQIYGVVSAAYTCPSVSGIHPHATP